MVSVLKTKEDGTFSKVNCHECICIETEEAFNLLLCALQESKTANAHLQMARDRYGNISISRK